jgi:threonylcarbamoyladenosine tRNA methylthiotransferase CDKAL1
LYNLHTQNPHVFIHASVSFATMYVNLRVFVKSFGCSSNTADSEVISGCLVEAGFQLTKSEENAKVVIYNTCAVKGPTENRIIEALKRIPNEKKVIVAGCLPLIHFERLKNEVRYDAAIGPAAGSDIVEVVSRVLNGEKIVALEGALTSKPRLDLPKIRMNPKISVIPINYGCLGKCAYCCVVHARGKLRSYSISEIVDRVHDDISKGISEIWITSQDTASYGRDIGTNLSALIRKVTSVEGNFMVRVGMMTPNVVKSFLGDLLEAFDNEKVFKFVHLPVQSGDNNVLRRMRRSYTAEDFEELVRLFRLRFSQITLSTDVICGFPGETLNAFRNTVQIIEKVQPDVVNISKFFARPKTAAWEMRKDAVEKPEVKRRTTIMAKVCKKIAFERNKLWLGWTGKIFVDEVGKLEETWIGRNFAYKPVSITDQNSMLGKEVHVKISKVFPTYLSGIIEEPVKPKNVYDSGV